MTSEREACPEPLLWAIARAFDAAVDGDPDPAARLLLGLAGLIYAAENYLPGEQPGAAAAMAEAIERAAPRMADHSAAKSILTDAGSRAAISLAIMFGQPFAEVRALIAVGLADEWADLVGMQRAEIETAWRATRLARRYAAHQGSAAVDTSGPTAGVSRH